MRGHKVLRRCEETASERIFQTETRPWRAGLCTAVVCSQVIIFLHLPSPVPSTSTAAAFCINRTIWKASAARPGNVNRPQGNITPRRSVSEGGEERKEGENGLTGTDGWNVKAWRVVECGGAQHRGELPPWRRFKQLIKSRLKG